MIVGLVVGYMINISITKNKFAYNKAGVESISNPFVKKQVEVSLNKYEAKKFSDVK